MLDLKKFLREHGDFNFNFIEVWNIEIQLPELILIPDREKLGVNAGKVGKANPQLKSMEEGVTYF